MALCTAYCYPAPNKHEQFYRTDAGPHLHTAQRCILHSVFEQKNLQLAGEPDGRELAVNSTSSSGWLECNNLGRPKGQAHLQLTHGVGGTIVRGTTDGPGTGAWADAVGERAVASSSQSRVHRVCTAFGKPGTGSSNRLDSCVDGPWAHSAKHKL